MSANAELIKGNWFDVRGYHVSGVINCQEYPGSVVILCNESDHFLVGLVPSDPHHPQDMTLGHPGGTMPLMAMFEEAFCYREERETRYAYLQACLLAARIAATH